jgi:uncharacterized Fe-S center protein
MAEYSMAVTYGRPCFHVSLVMDISPWCDCGGFNDAPIIPDVGMLCSFDPVALDQACVDLCDKEEKDYFKNSQLGDRIKKGEKMTGHVFHDDEPETDPDSALEHAEKIGLGSRQYDLVVVK